MVITEKPSAAKKIAEALDGEHSPKEVPRAKNRYYECKRGNDELVVVYALGHLFELKQTEKGWTYPRFDNQWVPKYEVNKKATGIKPIINLIKKLAKTVDAFIVATDYDIEGSLIGYLTLEHACKADTKQAKRMRFSSLTSEELSKAYESAGSLNFPMIEAGLVRHEIDWLYGINLTRALTLSIKKAEGWFKIVSTGRVQGPTLSYVIARDRDVNLFVPHPYWVIQVEGMHQASGTEVEVEYSKKRLDVKKDAIQIENILQGKSARLDSIQKKTKTQIPNPPFNLSSLQYEAYRHFGYKPSRTLAVAQKLYLEALISYPRTSSEQLPTDLDFRGILKGLSASRKYTKLVSPLLKMKILSPVQGKKKDPAHPAIHPTGEKPKKRLTPTESKLYDLIVKRFAALFGEPSIRERMRCDLSCENHRLYIRGLQIIEQGWMELYEPYAKVDEKILPDMKEGDLIKLDSVMTMDKYSKPPARFNPSSILKLLEKEGLGTKSTRSRIVDSLKSRGYVLNERFELSTLGYALYETLEEFVPEVMSPELTRNLEKQMELIQEGEKERDHVLNDAKSSLEKILSEFNKKEDEIGRNLVDGLRRYWKAKEELGPCPACNDGTLLIIRSSKTGKRFVGCSNYREKKCSQTFPLPKRGGITPLDEVCPDCGHKMIRVSSGRRPWKTCINWAECPGRKDELKKQQKAKSKEKEST